MKKENDVSRNEALQKMISEAQKKPGIIELMTLHGELDKLMMISKEYLSAYHVRTTSTLSNKS
jgi:hypothetical protein